MNGFTYTVFTLFLLVITVRWWLAARQISYVNSHREAVPQAFADKIPLQAHQRAADYTSAKTRLGIIENLYTVAAIAILTFGGVFNLLDNLWQEAGLEGALAGAAFLLSLFFISGVLELPLSLVNTFGLERRFGFSKISFGLYIRDLLAQVVVALIIGTPLIWLVVWIMDNAGSLWWLWVWAVWMSFSLLMLWAYPAFIAPLFNKFSPLEDGELRQRLEGLLQRCGFASNGIFVMDGSRRSAHSNAYFTGMGNNKRIVFYDTLVEQLTPQQLEAVVAHELGHFHHRHIHKRLAVMSLTTLAGIGLLAWLLQQPWYFAGMNIDNQASHTGLGLYLLLIPALTFFTTPLMSRAMRHHEFQADDYAAEHSDSNALIDALVRLYKSNAATLTPDPLYSGFYDSHPSAPERIGNLQQGNPGFTTP